MSTVNSSASVRFIVAISGNGRNWSPTGFATLVNGRVKLDDRLIKNCPRGTRINEDIRKACHWLNAETAAISCDLPWRSVQFRVVRIRE